MMLLYLQIGSAMLASFAAGMWTQHKLSEPPPSVKEETFPRKDEDSKEKE